MYYRILFIILALCFIMPISAQDTTTQFIYGDALPDAPELAYRGEYAVGVRTISVVNEGVPNIYDAGYPDAVYDRELVLEVWYPASLAEDEEAFVLYDETLANYDDPDNPITFSFAGRATRDAAPLDTDAPFPLVIVSHGFPGTRVEFSNLTENLASKGYVVVAIDHAEPPARLNNSVNAAFLYRAYDIEFVIQEMATLSEGDEFLGGLVDADNTALVGYSMGAYGALNTIGAGYSPFLGFAIGPPLRARLESSPGHLPLLDTRIKAAVLIAPFGGDLGFAGLDGVSLWSDTALSNITVPTFWVSGTNDYVAIHDAVVRLFNEATNSERYMLTYYEAEHSIPVNPPPLIGLSLQNYERYSDPVWDKRRMNNINQHFITAFLDLYLKGDEAMRDYIEPTVPVASECEWSMGFSGNPRDNHTCWKGFIQHTYFGLELQFDKP